MTSSLKITSIAMACLLGWPVMGIGEPPMETPPGPPPGFTPPPPPMSRPPMPYEEKSIFPDDRRERSGWKEPMTNDTGGESLEVVERFLEMPPERLSMIRALIERIEQMTPEERQAMRTRLASYRELTQERRARMMEEFKQVPVQDRLLLRMYWRSLPAEEASAEKEKLHRMSAEERAAYRESLLDKARAAGISLAPPSPPPNIEIPPPPELLPPPFPEGLRPPPPAPPASAHGPAVQE